MSSMIPKQNPNPFIACIVSLASQFCCQQHCVGWSDSVKCPSTATPLQKGGFVSRHKHQDWVRSGLVALGEVLVGLKQPKKVL